MGIGEGIRTRKTGMELGNSLEEAGPDPELARVLAGQPP